MNATVAIAIPVYQAQLNPIEAYSLDTSVRALAGRKLTFVAPNGLDTEF